MSDWLDQAQRLLCTGGEAAAHRNRSVCWLARAGLEYIVRDLLRDAGYEVGEASMRTQLSCLEAAYHRRQPQLAARTLGPRCPAPHTSTRTSCRRRTTSADIWSPWFGLHL